MDILELLKALDAPLAVAVVVVVGWRIIKHLREEVARERAEKTEIITKLEAATQARLDDKDAAAQQFHDTVVRVEQTMVKTSEARTAVMKTVERIARKVGAE